MPEESMQCAKCHAIIAVSEKDTHNCQPAEKDNFPKVDNM